MSRYVPSLTLLFYLSFLTSSFGRLTTVDRDITARCLVIMNRADPALVSFSFSLCLTALDY